MLGGFMAYIKFLIVLFSTCAFASLPKMLTKIPLASIRFISNDGKITLYQKSSGALALATNYNTDDILKLKEYTQFNANSIIGSDYITIEADQNYNSHNDALKNKDLYLIKRKELKPVKVGSGKDLVLHLKGSFYSFFDARGKSIKVATTKERKILDEIRISSKLNPYFSPETLMIDANTFIYTDINEKNLSGVLYYNRSNKIIKPLFKSAEDGTRLEICLYKNNLIIGEFSYNGINRGSNIYKMKATGNIMKNSIDRIYSSESTDIGHLTCSENQVYFIKDFGSNGPINNRISELISLDINTKKFRQLSNLKKVFQVVQMDGRVLIPVSENLYVVEGSNNFKNDQLEKENQK